MSNTIEYGLKFNTKDLDNLLKKVKELDTVKEKSFKKQRERQTKLYDANKKENLKYNNELKKQFQSFLLFEKDGYARKMTMLKDSLISQRTLKKREAEVELINQKKTSIQRLNSEKITSQKIIQIRQKELAQKAKLATQAQVINLRTAQHREQLALQRLQGGGTTGGKGKGFVKDAHKMITRVPKYIATATVTYGTISAIRRGVSAVHEYNQALNDTYSVYGNLNEAEKERIRIFTQNQNLTNKYGKSYAELAQAMTVLAKAGLDVNESMILLEPALGLSVISGMDLDNTVMALSQTLRGAGREMGAAATLADHFAKVSVSSTVEIKDLAESMKIAGATGRTFGISMEEMVMWMGAFGNVGLKGRNAANAFSRSLLRMTKETEKLKKMGIDVFDPDTKRLREAQDLLKDFEEAGIDIVERQRLLGIYAMKSGAQLEAAVPHFLTIKEAMESSENVLEKMVEQQMAGLNQKANRLKNTWDNIFVSQNAVSNGLGKMYDTITNVLEYLARNPQATAALMTLLGGGAATIATAKIPFVGAAVGTGTVLTAAYQMFIKDYSEEKDNIEMAEMFKKASEDYDKELQGFIAELKNMNKDQLNKLLSEKDPIVLMHLKNLEQIKAVVKEYEDTIFDSRSSIEAKIKADEELPYYKEMLKREEQLLKIAQMKQSMRKASIGREITLRREPGAINETGSGGQKYQSIDAFLRKMQKLQRDANNTEVNEFKKKQQQIDDLLEHHLQEIADKKLTSQDRERATTEAYNTHQAQTLKNNYDENLRLLQEYLDEKKKMQKASDDKLQSQYDAVESINFSQNLQLQLDKLDGYYQALLALEHLSAEERLAVENEYVQKRQELMAEMYRKEYALNAEVWSAIKAGLDTFTSTLYDTEMTGRERWNAMVENMKMTFITAVSEMILKWLAFQALTGGLFGGFDSGLGSFLGQLFGVNKTSFKTPGMQNDFIYSQSQGVIPFRKDDIILGGTLGGGLNFSGQNTPSFSKSSSDRAIVDRLSSLEKTLGEVGGLISNTIIEYRPIVKTDTISNAKVYTMAKRGEIDMQIITK